jgi:hypothetical protein
VQEQLGVCNASQAVLKIKKALGGICLGAGEWLLTNPIRWAPGRAPVCRKSEAGSDSVKKHSR